MVSPVKMREFRRNYLHHGSSKHLFLEQAEGYVKFLEKSTSRFSTMRGVFEHRAQNT